MTGLSFTRKPLNYAAVQAGRGWDLMDTRSSIVLTHNKESRDLAVVRDPFLRAMDVAHLENRKSPSPWDGILMVSCAYHW
jgi:hypothetical protein